jgi:hypothetical protein
MRSILRTLVLAPVVMAAAALATNAAMAETTLTVPFSFKVAGKICPAGRYAVDRNLGHNYVTLVAKNAPVGFQWILTPGDDDRKNSDVTLSFDKQGEGYVLGLVQYGRLATHRLDKVSPHSEHKTISATGQGQ